MNLHIHVQCINVSLLQINYIHNHVFMHKILLSVLPTTGIFKVNSLSLTLYTYVRMYVHTYIDN